MKFSIALATYNGARFLPEQIDSYLSQTRPPDEVVICDDQSEDQTLDIISRFRTRSPFPVRIEQNPQRLGINGNFERAVGLCDGDVIFLSDQDDIWGPEKLARHEAVYRSLPDIGLVFSNGQVVDTAGEALGYDLFDTFGVRPSRQRAINSGHALEQLVKCSRATGCTISFRADWRDVLVPFSMHWHHDEWIALVMSALAPMQTLPESLLRYRLHEMQAIGASNPAEDRGLHPSWLPERIEHIDGQLAQLTELLDRLARFESRLLCRDYSRVIKRKLEYLQRRRSMPQPRLARVPAVIWEVIFGTYIRYGQWPKLELAADLFDHASRRARLDAPARMR
jgi:glycosyltransferase involved in cell wall biosynthesis